MVLIHDCLPRSFGDLKPPGTVFNKFYLSLSVHYSKNLPQNPQTNKVMLPCVVPQEHRIIHTRNGGFCFCVNVRFYTESAPRDVRYRSGLEKL